MSRYSVMITPDLEENYKRIAKQLEMSMEQVISEVLQIYAERLTLQPFGSACDTERVRKYEEEITKD